MNQIIFKSIGILFFCLSLIACKKTTVEAEKTTSEKLMANDWQLDRYTNTSGKTLSNVEVGSQAAGLYSMLFRFQANNITKGVEKTSKQVINAGSWYLKENNTIIDIAVIGFGGKFKIVEISSKKLILQTDTNNLIFGIGNVVNLEFYPAL